MARWKIKKLLWVCGPLLLAAGLATGLSVPLDTSMPALGKLLFPGSGIWTVPDGYPDTESWNIGAVEEPVTVFRDDWGVPHIYGRRSEDIAFAMGYVQAQDRLFFMDLARRFARGQLAEVIGPGALADDVVSKTKLLEHYAQKTIDHLRTSADAADRDYYRYVQSYVKGVNFFVETHPNQLPLEFHLLDYTFRPWTDLDCMAIAYFMLEGGPWGYWDLDRLVAMDAFIKHFGPNEGTERFQELFGAPGEGRVLPGQVPVHPGYGRFDDAKAFGHARKAAGSDIRTIVALADGLKGLLTGIEAAARESRRLNDPGFTGSNSWVVHGRRTRSGHPLACSDSHEPWSLPNIYYETHAVNTAADHNFYGYYVAGGAATPVDGHNRHITWGMTVCHWDQIDWYYYDTAGQGNYLYKGRAVPFEAPITVTIPVRGRDPVTHTIQRTVHGPVFSGLDKALPKAFRPLPEPFSHKIIAARWLSHKVVDLGPALLGMSRARNLDEFSAAMRGFEAPPNHVTYADAQGNIAAWSMGGFPVRDDRNLPAWHLGNGAMPYNGSAGEGEWVDMVTMDDLPSSLNPDQGFLVGANQMAAGPDYLKRHVGQFRHREGYRARRLNDLLAEKNLTVDDMARIHSDVTSLRAEDFTPHLLAAMAGMAMNPPEQAAYDLLSRWDFTMDKDLSAPSIFWTWIEFMAENTFGDQWKAMGLGDRLLPQHPILEKLIRTDPASVWFDDLTTPDVTEDAGNIMKTSIRQAVAALSDYFKTDDPSQWRWGRVHQLEFFHMTGELDALNYGPVPYSGASNTITAPHNKLLVDGKLAPAAARRGAHHRMIVDFGNPENSRSVLPGGVSGLSTLGAPFDQFDLFVNGEYHSEYFTADTPEKFLEQCRSVTSRIDFSPTGG